MDFIAFLVEIFPTVGFPIICCGVLGFFIFKIYQDSIKQREAAAAQNAENMAAVQKRCQEREEKLYIQLEKQNTINGRFAEIIAQYEIKLDEIKDDVKEIKEDVLLIKAKQA